MNMKSVTPNLIVEDVNKTTEWYKEILGFEMIMSVPETGKDCDGYLLIFAEDQTKESA